MGLAAVLILTIIALTTAALSGDQKAEMRQIALALTDVELNRFAKAVSVKGSPARAAFWNATDGAYTGTGTNPTVNTNDTEFSLEYTVTTVTKPSSTATFGDAKPGNRLRKLDLKVSWWNGEQGKPGYGRLSVSGTRLLRESDLRES